VGSTIVKFFPGSFPVGSCCFSGKAEALSDLEQQGLIQSFEYPHELSWNVLRDYLKDQGTQQLHGTKDTI
jgi:hypothetical protein